MSTLKNIINEMSYEEFEAKVRKPIMSAASYKKYAKQGMPALIPEEKRDLVSRIYFYLDFEKRGLPLSAITDDEIRYFVVASTFKSAFHK